MAKKCTKCGFDKNPDDAHYCGACGNKISGDWRLYNYNSHTVVADSRLRQLQGYESEVNNSPWMRMGRWWKNTGSTLAAIVGCVVAGACVVVGAIYLYMKFVDGDGDLKRVYVNGKYGIGASADDLALPAEYDSISAYTDGHQWVIVDKTTGKKGVAYVTKKKSSVIAPAYSQVYLYDNGTSLLEVADKNYSVAYEGALVGTGYERVYNANGYSSFAEGNVMVAHRTNGGSVLLDSHGKELGEYDRLLANDGIICATRIGADGVSHTSLLDSAGKPTTDKTFYEVVAFSDGVAWAKLSKDKSSGPHGSIALIDREGNTLFELSPFESVTGFRDGMAWYTAEPMPKGNGTRVWNAIDKSGKSLGSVKARTMHGYSMGLAPSIDGQGRLGFIDRNMRVAIPYEYTYAGLGNPSFRTDSTMLVRHKNVLGTLHANGNFTPNNK